MFPLLSHPQEDERAGIPNHSNEVIFSFKIPSSRFKTLNTPSPSNESVLRNYSATMIEETPQDQYSLPDEDTAMHTEYEDTDDNTSQARSNSITAIVENGTAGSPAMHNGFDDRPPPRRGAPAISLADVRRSQRAHGSTLFMDDDSDTEPSPTTTLSCQDCDSKYRGIHAHQNLHQHRRRRHGSPSRRPVLKKRKRLSGTVVTSSKAKRDARKGKAEGQETETSSEKPKIFCPNPGCDRHKDALTQRGFKISHHRDMHLITCRFNSDRNTTIGEALGNAAVDDKAREPDHGYGSSMGLDRTYAEDDRGAFIGSSVESGFGANTRGVATGENTQPTANAKDETSKPQSLEPAKQPRIQTSEVTNQVFGDAGTTDPNRHFQTLYSLRAKAMQYRRDMDTAEQEFKLRRDKVEKIESVISYLETDI